MKTIINNIQVEINDLGFDFDEKYIYYAEFCYLVENRYKSSYFIYRELTFCLKNKTIPNIKLLNGEKIRSISIKLLKKIGVANA